MSESPAPVRPQVILLGGASGSGKSYLARRYGRPHFPLDAYYRELSEDPEHGGPGPALPRTPYGEVDWDHHLTWNERAAVDAIVELLEEGTTLVPDYRISSSSVVGAAPLALDGGGGALDGGVGHGHGLGVGLGVGVGVGPIVAEGIFADRMPAALARADVPFTAWYIDSPRGFTAVRRFGRDVAERRKPVPFLVQRGWALYRSDAADRARAIAAGFVPRSKRILHRDLGAISAR